MNKKNRQQLINDLSSQVTAVKPTNVWVSLFFWMSVAFALSTLLMLAVAPFRENSLFQLGQSKQFLIESVVGVLCILILIYAAFESAIPSPKSLRERLTLPVIAVTAWISFYILGLFYPALEYSTGGIRHYCWLETFVYGLPMMAVGLFWIKRQWPVIPRLSAILIGLASGAVPAFLMQFACMYDPLHTLEFHLLPGLLLGLVSGFIGTYYLKK